LKANSNKIALVANTSWSIYNFRLGLIREFQKKGYQVAVIAPKDSFTARLVAEGIEYYEVAMDNYGTNPISEIKLIRQFYRLYTEINPSIIFHYTIKPNIYGSLAAAKLGIPSIIVTTGLGHLFQFSNTFVRWITLFLYKVACKLAHETWFLNENDRDVFIFKGIAKIERTKVLKSEGVDVNWFKPRREKTFYRDRFLFAGRLLYDKGVEIFVDAARIIKVKYPRAKFEILGFIDQSNPNSIPYDKINNWQKEKTIKYLGETNDIRPYLEKSSCLVFPSYYREGVSRILLEASAMETPIITTDNVGCREVVEDGRTGFLCTPKSVDDLVKSIEEFINLSDEDKLCMGKLGRKKIVKEYNLDEITQKYLDAVENILQRKPQKKINVKSP
jgi:glycosyltransferase involved in cell wall biosynthesis